MPRPHTIYLDPPADDLLMVAPGHLKPSRRFDPERLVERLGRRPSLAEVVAARVQRGLVRADTIILGDRPEPLPMGPGKSLNTLTREAEAERRREERRKERERRRQKREALAGFFGEEAA